MRQLGCQWRRFDLTSWYLPLGPLLLAASFVPSMQNHGTQVGGVPGRAFDTLAVVAIALQCLPLMVCRRCPAVCLTLVSLGFAADQLRGYHSLAGTGLALALLGAGSRLERHRRGIALALSVAYVPLAVALSRLGSGEPVGEFVLFYVVTALVWGMGTWLRFARAAEAERRRHVAEETRTAERTRIARELHDVVTHHVTAMVVQAEAARYLTAAPERLEQTLSAVSDTGRQAISDLRHLLDLLNPDHGTAYGTGRGTVRGTAAVEVRAPHIGRVGTLVEQTRRAGQPVEFTEEGTPAESTGSAALVAYRVVQEALTNALKHAHGIRTSVRVHHGEKEMTVEVSTEALRPRAASPGGSGRGLAGLRERVDVLGGEFSAGTRTDGGFVVRARIPSGRPS
ncbi:sensor histidine kinase [Streptomyces sp. NPDC048441]|uniref:sensor histidine kinase n=1 Tax=Streptomyces sp. NPDC048441 TaxID=3365552 RepID=UPI0037144F60